jgi:hypothetical protein
LIRRTLLSLFLICTTFAFLPQASAQPHDDSPSSNATKTANVFGKWQVAWQGRLGTEQCTLQLQQKSSNKLEGTLQDQRGLSPLSGTIEGNKVTFNVNFGGPRPFTTEFTGTVTAGKIEGTSKAINVEGAGAYLGHGGEVVQPEHPWTATRGEGQSAEAGGNESKVSPNSPAKN